MLQIRIPVESLSSPPTLFLLKQLIIKPTYSNIFVVLLFINDMILHTSSNNPPPFRMWNLPANNQGQQVEKGVQLTSHCTGSGRNESCSEILWSSKGNYATYKTIKYKRYPSKLAHEEISNCNIRQLEEKIKRESRKLYEIRDPLTG